MNEAYAIRNYYGRSAHIPDIHSDEENLRIFGIIALIAFGQVLDFITTLASLERGGTELNPVTQSVIIHFGAAGFLFEKAMLAALIATVLRGMNGATLCIAAPMLLVLTFIPVICNLFALR